MALADGRLLRQQPGVEQRLADGLRERAVVAREAAREMGEVGVVAAPLPHPVEPLEDPPRDPAPGSGSSWGRAAAGALGVEQREHGLLVLLDRALVRGAAAEPRDRLGDAQRVAGADRRAERDVGQHRAAGTAWARARRRSMPAGVLVERERGELVERGRVEPRRGQREDEEAVPGRRR